MRMKKMIVVDLGALLPDDLFFVVGDGWVVFAMAIVYRIYWSEASSLG